MKILLTTILVLLFQATAFSGTLDSLKFQGNYLYYHKITSDKKTENTSLIIYMHGGVSQFKGAKPKAVEALDLLEGNKDFLPTATNAGYDVILPIAYNEYNWLNDTGELYINKIVGTYKNDYQRIIISGFSDGGTGALRFFYNHPEQYAGLLLFNGYPQLKNYYKKINHYDGIGKNIIYGSCYSDKVIPYEFLLVEYRRQAMINEHTYFLLVEGNHSFSSYTKAHLELCMELMGKTKEQNVSPNKITIYPPIDGLVIDGQLKDVYPFRKKTAKNYSMADTEYKNDSYIYKTYKKLLSDNATITLSPITIDKASLKQGVDFDFDITINGNKEIINLTNWLNTPTW